MNMSLMLLANSLLLTLLIFVLVKIFINFKVGKKQVGNRDIIDKALFKDVKKAIKHQQLHLFYQPILNKERQIVAVEALLRWNHPKHGAICPEAIIEIAEKEELIGDLGEWIIRTACFQVKKWQEDFHMNLNVSVNISPQQLLDPDLLVKVERILKESNFKPCHLEFEITEKINIFDINNIQETLLKLKLKGISFSIDDFGTGYSSLEYIDRLPIDRIKIDKYFVMNINPEEEKSFAIAQTAISLAEKLSIEVVAEGVESLYQFDLLRDHSCHRYQGYYFYKPIDARECQRIFSKLCFQQTEENSRNRLVSIVSSLNIPKI